MAGNEDHLPCTRRRVAMSSLPKGFFKHTLTGLQARFQHAFSTAPESPLAAEDIVFLERAADAIVQRGMAVPAVLFLQSLGPVNFLGSQAVHFFTPLLEVVFPVRDVQRVALLLERRETLSRLAQLIEKRAETGRP